MHTILGAGGAIGFHLAETLPIFGAKVRLVSREPKPVKGKEEIVSADLLRRKDTLRAVKGSEVVYLTAGLRYNARVWEKQWPIVMRNVIDACKTHNARLVFFDNVYMYGKVKGWMTENTPFNPCSRKGEVRAKIATMLLDEIQKGEITALIARSSDFYGPSTPNSYLNNMILDNLRLGKNPRVLFSRRNRHSFTFTPDAAYATAILGTTPEAFNQTWHLPTDHRVLTIGQMIVEGHKHTIYRNEGTIVKPWVIDMLSYVNPLVRESKEMLYQFEGDFLFDSSKFDHYHGFEKIPYALGIEKTMYSFPLGRRKLKKRL
jgi:nucleoside-diphosphate-sugar epimerase